MPTEVKRGEIYWVDWNPARGREQAGKRPALIIQNDIGNQYSSTTIVAACSTASEKPYPFIVNITAIESGLPKDSSVNLSRIITIEKSRLLEKCGQLSAERMEEVNTAITHSLEIY